MDADLLFRSASKISLMKSLGQQSRHMQNMLPTKICKSKRNHPWIRISLLVQTLWQAFTLCEMNRDYGSSCQTRSRPEILASDPNKVWWSCPKICGLMLKIESGKTRQASFCSETGDGILEHEQQISVQERCTRNKDIILSICDRIFFEKIIAFFRSGNFEAVRRACPGPLRKLLRSLSWRNITCNHALKLNCWQCLTLITALARDQLHPASIQSVGARAGYCRR